MQMRMGGSEWVGLRPGPRGHGIGASSRFTRDLPSRASRMLPYSFPDAYAKPRRQVLDKVGEFP